MIDLAAGLFDLAQLEVDLAAERADLDRLRLGLVADAAHLDLVEARVDAVLGDSNCSSVHRRRSRRLLDRGLHVDHVHHRALRVSAGDWLLAAVDELDRAADRSATPEMRNRTDRPTSALVVMFFSCLPRRQVTSAPETKFQAM